MMIITTYGVLRTTETVGELVALHGRDDVKIAPWYLPKFIQRTKFLEVYKSCFCDDEYEQFLKYRVDKDGYPKSQVLPSSVELEIWDKMKDDFYGPIENCPAPYVPEQIVQAWGDFLMYKLVKFSDVRPTCPPECGCGFHSNGEVQS